MRIGLAGAHRVGKTTLGLALAEHLGVPFVETHVSRAKIWDETGIAPSDSVTFAERVRLQRALVRHLKEVFDEVKGCKEGWVADRTYLDLLGYLFANVDATCSNLWSSEVAELVADVRELTAETFDKIVLLQPAIPVQTVTNKCGKVYVSNPYREAINNHVLAYGLKTMPAGSFFAIAEDVLSVEDRLDYIIRRI